MSDEIQVRSIADDRSDYVLPAIIHELTLETRAGSPLGGDPLIDLLDLEPVAGD